MRRRQVIRAERGGSGVKSRMGPGRTEPEMKRESAESHGDVLWVVRERGILALPPILQ